MVIQKTPPPGWPHTEAEKHRDSLHAPPQRGAMPTPPPPRSGSRGRFGCCLGLAMFLVAVVGVAALVAWGAFSESDQSDFDAASSAFRSMHPAWLVESVDRPDEGSDAVRLVAWNDSYYIGRLVYMIPDENTSDGWLESPLIPALEGDRAAEEAFIAAFSSTYSDTAWTYVQEVQPVDLTSEPQVWQASCRVLEQASEEWTELRMAHVERDAETGEWVVYAGFLREQ